MDKRKIYVLGRTTLDEDEDEAIRELGKAMQLTERQLVTAKGVEGVAQAVDFGFRSMGGVTEYITPGTIPDSRDVIIFADPAYAARVQERVPDWQDRGWLFVMNAEGLFEFHFELLKVLADKGIALPPKGGGAVVISPSGSGRKHRSGR